MPWDISQTIGSQVFFTLSNLFSLCCAALWFCYYSVRYFRSLHGRYAAFTAGLPVALTTIVWAKVLWGWVWLTMSSFIALATLVTGGQEMSRTFYVAELNSDNPSIFARALPMPDHGLHFVVKWLAQEPVMITGLAVLVMMVVLAVTVEGAFIISVGSSPALCRFGRFGGIGLAALLGFLIRNLFTFLGLGMPLGVIRYQAEDGRYPLQLVELDPFTFDHYQSQTLNYEQLFHVGALIGACVAMAIFAVCLHRTIKKHYSLCG